MIKHRHIQPGTLARFQSRTATIHYPATQASYIMAALASSSMTVGTALTLLETTTRGITSISFTPGGAPASAFTFTVIGENQFGEVVTESVTTGTSANIVHTVKCYRKIISITPTAKSSTGADTVAIGWTCVVTSGTPRLAIPCKLESTSSLLYVHCPWATGAMPTFTPELTNYTIAVSTAPLLNATVGGTLLLTLNGDDPGL